jgi:hypothetical protein
MSPAAIAQLAVMALNAACAVVCIAVLRRWRRRLVEATATMTTQAAIYRDHLAECHRA